MIYLDVTGACRLALQTGIPRTTRALYALIQEMGAEVTPIVWQPFLNSYTELSPRSRALLEDPLKVFKNSSAQIRGCMMC